MDNSDQFAGLDLLKKQQIFATLAAGLIMQANKLGFDVTLGDAYRDPRVHGAWGVTVGYSKARSVHKCRLAIDLALFRGGEYLRESADYQPLGQWWEAQGGTWGGRWGDGNHFSIAHQGCA